jgi:hypothetical protein
VISLLLTLMACPAEQLRIELPKGGLQALSMEDVQRDLQQLDQLGDRSFGTPGHEESARRVQRRLEEMHTLPGYGRVYAQVTDLGVVVCGQKDGQGGGVVVVLALDEGGGSASSGAQVAALISLAKTFDVPAQPARSVLLCAAPSVEAYLAKPAWPPDKTVALLTLGPLAGQELSSTESEVAGIRRVHLDSGPVLPENDRMSLVDGRVVLARIEAVREALEALL